jgi:DNA primase
MLTQTAPAYLHPYFAFRGIRQQTAIAFDLGYSLEAGDTLSGRIIIPVRDSLGEIAGFAARWPGEPPFGVPKYKFSPGFDPQSQLFNFDRATEERPDKPLLIVEGFFDAMKLFQHGYRKLVALMGPELSKTQEELLGAYIIQRSQIILMLNRSELNPRCLDPASRLMQLCFVRVHHVEHGRTAGDLSIEELESLLGFAL